MAITHLLDTSVYSQPIKKISLKSVIDRWEHIGDASLCSSIICEAEILYGLELKASEKLRKMYEHILKDRLPLFGLDIKVIALYAQYQAFFKKQGNIRPVFDLLIACTALAHNLILVTCNSKDFLPFAGLKIEYWSEK